MNVAENLCGPNASESSRQQIIASIGALRKPDYLATLQVTTYQTQEAHLEAVRAPTLLIFGENDKLTPPAVGAQMHARIRGSDFTVLKGAGHLVNIEAPIEFNTAVQAFLSRVTIV